MQCNCRNFDFQQEKGGSIFLHPFDDRHLIAGYGSLGIEILKDVPDVDFALVCCGGGGLLAGTSAALTYLASKSVRIFGVEPENASGMKSSLLVNISQMATIIFLKSNAVQVGRRGCAMSPSKEHSRRLGSSICWSKCFPTHKSLC